MAGISLGQTEVGAIYLGGTQIYPTGTANKYNFTLTNVKAVYTDGGTTLLADGSNAVFFQGTYTVKRGTTTISTQTVMLNIGTTPTYTVKDLRGRLVWNKAVYGTTAVVGRTVTVQLNYGHITTTSSFLLGANSKTITNSECQIFVNGTSTRTTIPKAGGTYPIEVWARVTYSWTSGMGTYDDEIEDPTLFNFWTDGEDWADVSGTNLVVSRNTGTTSRTTYLYATMIGYGNVNSQIEITQNYL